MSQELTSQILNSTGNTSNSTFNLKVVALSTSLHSYAQNHLIGVFHRLTGASIMMSMSLSQAWMKKKFITLCKKDWANSAIT